MNKQQHRNKTKETKKSNQLNKEKKPKKRMREKDLWI